MSSTFAQQLFNVVLLLYVNLRSAIIREYRQNRCFAGLYSVALYLYLCTQSLEEQQQEATTHVLYFYSAAIY